METEEEARPVFPAYSTSSVEFVEKVPHPQSAPLQIGITPAEYFFVGLMSFPQLSDPLPLGSYIIGLDAFDIVEFRSILLGAQIPRE